MSLNAVGRFAVFLTLMGLPALSFAAGTALFPTSALRDSGLSIPKNGQKDLVQVKTPVDKIPVLRLTVSRLDKPWEANLIVPSSQKPKAGGTLVMVGYGRVVSGNGKIRVQCIAKPNAGFGEDMVLSSEWKVLRVQKTLDQDAQSLRLECIVGYQDQVVELAGLTAVAFASAEEAGKATLEDLLRLAFDKVPKDHLIPNPNPKGPYGFQPPFIRFDWPEVKAEPSSVIVTGTSENVAFQTWRLPEQAQAYGITNSPDFSIKIGGKEIPVYTSFVNPVREVKAKPKEGPTSGQTVLSWATLEADGPVTFDIVVNRDFEKVEVKPLIQKIPLVVDGRRIRVTLNPQQKAVLQFDGSQEKCLALFPNPRHTPPPKNLPGLTWFGPGIHPVGHRLLKNNETIYLAGGAVVSGTFFGEGVTNIRIFGPGVLDGSKITHYDTLGIELRRCRDVMLDGFVFRDSPHWTIVPRVSTNITIHNLKIMNWRINGDGIDPCNTRDVWVSNCFVWASDDVMSPKGCVWFNMTEAATVPLENLFVSNVLGFNHAGYMVRVGDETAAPWMSNLVFRDLHVNVLGEPIGLINCDRALQTDILVDGLNIERYFGYFLDLQIFKGRYTFDKDLRGKTENILFRNVRMLGKEAGAGGARFLGFDADHKVKNVTVEGYIDGKGQAVGAIRPQDETNAFTENIRFIPLGGK